jgi:hypothetical protein
MTSKENSFKTKAKREEEYVEAYFNYKNSLLESPIFTLKHSEDKYSAYDSTLLVDGVPVCVIEVKVRSRYSLKQINNWGGSFLEEQKLRGIVVQQRNEGIDLPIAYMNFYNDKVVVYNLSKKREDHIWFKQELQRNDFDSGTKRKSVTRLKNNIVKEVIDINLIIN